MLKGIFLFYLLSRVIRNPFLALILLVGLYLIADKAYLGFLPDFLAPLRRNSRIKALRAQVELNPADAASAQELGILFFEKKDYRTALDYLQRANEKVHNSARLYLYMGMSYMEIKQIAQGKEALDKAIELDRRVGHGVPYTYLLGYELKTDGANLQNIKELEEDLANFANTENFFRMGMVYQRLGRKAQARSMFEKALDEYAYVPKRLRRIHRRWAVLSRIHLLIS